LFHNDVSKNTSGGLVTIDASSLPPWALWRPTPFPDGNLLLLPGRQPALVDSGFVGHASETVAWVRAHTPDLDLVLNTHWHADHVGANGVLQAGGAGVAASTPDAMAVNRRDPGCCQMEYFDQPVAPYTVDEPLADGRRLLLGDTEWQVVATPGHTPGHLALWQPDERLLLVGDAMSDYDVGMVQLALDGPDIAKTALASLERMADLNPRVLLPAHGPIPTDTPAALATAWRRAQRLVDDPDGSVWYSARRIFAYQLIIRGGLPVATVEPYLHERPWLQDAAGLLGRRVEEFTAELLDSMVRGGSIVLRDGRLHASIEHTSVEQATLVQPMPGAWP
jgi:glyoxylase-like metal-dependent hydrolase (beta-lactamase superfamily II)